MEIHCHICGLFLGQAAGEVEITCPLCLQLLDNVRYAVKKQAPVSGFSYQLWTLDVTKKAQLIGDITYALYQAKSLDILVADGE